MAQASTLATIWLSDSNYVHPLFDWRVDKIYKLTVDTMAKNIVICIDGTGNEFGNTNSNVVKLFSTLRFDDCSQIAYYHPGLGTMGAPNALSKFGQWVTKVAGQAFGFGLSGILTDTYTFLMENFEAGDKIYLFGFSRGAYSCRALAAMLHMFGLVRRGNEPLIPYVLRMFKAKQKDFPLAAQFKTSFSRECKVHFVGLWDTVSSVGWVYNPVSLPFTFANPDIRIGRHAVSIDERRCAFRQNLWSAKTIEGQDIKQLWFPGVHSDIGGGYAEAESGLAKLTLEWMLEEAEKADLQIDLHKKSQILGYTSSSCAKPDPGSQLHNSLKGPWRLLELMPRKHKDMQTNPPITRWEIPLSKPRKILQDAEFHVSTFARMKTLPEYRPSNVISIRPNWQSATQTHEPPVALV